jgi:hypothetical protein
MNSPARRKRPGQVLLHLRRAVDELAAGGGGEHVGQNTDERGEEEAEDQHGPHQPPGRQPRGLHHHQLAFVDHPVEDVERRHEGRDRQHQHHDLRQGQRGELKENAKILAVRDEAVEEVHRRLDPVDRDQHEAEEAEQDDQLRQDIAVELSQA